MLKGIHPSLNADVLGTLWSMGHGDTLVIADTNFPSSSTATSTTVNRVLHMENLSSAQALAAIFTVFPLDNWSDKFVFRTEIDGDAAAMPSVQKEVQRVLDVDQGRPTPMTPVDRSTFYGLARKSFAVVQTGEKRIYGCFIIKKGVIQDSGDAVYGAREVLDR